jgi:hypothetical protein
MRLPRWCFAHEGSDHENYHVHFALQAPILDVDHMCCVLNAVWAQHHAQTASLAKNWIMPVQDRAAVASYVTHEYWRMGSGTLLDELCWDRTPVDTMAQYHHDQQAHRITRAARSLSSNSRNALGVEDWLGIVNSRIQRPRVRNWFTVLKLCEPPFAYMTASVFPWVGRTAPNDKGIQSIWDFIMPVIAP